MTNWTVLLWEVLRKLVHLFGLLVVVIFTTLRYYFNEQTAFLGLTVLLIILVKIEYFRLEHRPKFLRVFDPIFRLKEANHMAGDVFLVISSIICFASFNYWVAVAALFMAVLGDLSAALFGKFIGGPVIFREKTLVGTLSGFIINLIVGLLILPQWMILVVPMAITASVVELVTNKLDDNFTVPLFAGFVGQMTLYFIMFVYDAMVIVTPASFLT